MHTQVLSSVLQAQLGPALPSEADTIPSQILKSCGFLGERNGREAGTRDQGDGGFTSSRCLSCSTSLCLRLHSSKGFWASNASHTYHSRHVLATRFPGHSGVLPAAHSSNLLLFQRSSLGSSPCLVSAVLLSEAKSFSK